MPVLRAYIGLGANLGDALGSLRTAAHEIAHLPGDGTARGSSIWRSAPVGASGPDFLNAVIGIDTTLNAPELLNALNAIETAHGRARLYRNAPRTLDLDLLLHGDAVVRLMGLTVPHPRMHLRRFVLAPLIEIDPLVNIPELGPAQTLLAATADQRCERTEQALLPAQI